MVVDRRDLKATIARAIRFALDERPAAAPEPVAVQPAGA
jgi:hypothetical protein